MTVGMPPFVHKNREKLFQKITQAEVKYPPWISESCKRLVAALLSLKPETRLGCKEGGFEELRSNEWFKDISFSDICSKKIIAP